MTTPELDRYEVRMAPSASGTWLFVCYDGQVIYERSGFDTKASAQAAADLIIGRHLMATETAAACPHVWRATRFKAEVCELCRSVRLEEGDVRGPYR